jgi:hypothetical protein
MKRKKRYSLGFIAFFQALSLILYCSLIALLFWQGNQWFGKLPNYFGPLLFLVLFSTSALICAVITLSYPFILWQKKQLGQAVRLIIYTSGWLIFFTLLLLILIVLFR